MIVCVWEEKIIEGKPWKQLVDRWISHQLVPCGETKFYFYKLFVLVFCCFCFSFCEVFWVIIAKDTG